MTVLGTSNISGSISATATSNGWGGGSGGSVNLTTGTISGAGSISAGGGNHGGGGGRVAVILTGSGADFSGFTLSNITAYGGGSPYGGAGTVYEQTQAQGAGQGSLIIDNNSHNGAVTDINSSIGASVGTVTLQNKGLLTIESGGTLTLNGSGSTISVGSGTTLTNNGTIAVTGNWGNTMTFTTGTVAFTGTNQSITTSNTFYNLTKSVSSAATLTFTNGTTQTISNTLTLNGTAGNLLSLRSSSTGNQWNFNPQSTRSITYVDTKDSNNTNTTAIAFSNSITDSGNNTNWSFDTTAPTVTVTSPTNSTNYSNSSVSMSASASDTNLGSLIPNLDNSLISWWRGEGNANDYLGTNNGTAHGGVTYTAGKFGNAMTFNGTDGYVSISSDPFYNTNATQLSISFWMNPILVPSNTYMTIVGQVDSPRPKGWHVIIDDRSSRNKAVKLEIGVATGVQYQDVYSYSAPATAGDWQHYVITYNGSVGTVYKNGVSQTVSYGTSSFGNFVPKNSPDALGAIADTLGANKFNGSLDDVQFYNRALTSDEITALYNGTAISHSSTLADGSHTYKAYAEDLAGNVGVSSTNTFSVDTVAPTVSAVAVHDGLNVDITFSEAMGTGVTTANNYTVSGTGKGTLGSHPNSVAHVSGNQYRLTWTSGEMFNGGDITIAVATAQDSAGNSIGSPNSGTDTGHAIGVAPTGYSVSIDQSYINNTNKNSISFTFAGAEVGDAYNYSFTGTSGAPITGSGTISSASQQITGINLSGLGEGSVTLTAYLTDPAGNIGGNVTNAKTKDTVAPTTGDNFTHNDVWEAVSQTITLAPADTGGTGVASTKYCLDSSNACDPTAGTLLNSPYQITISTEGVSYLHYESTDTAGNTQTTVSRTVKIDTIAPMIPGASPAGGTYDTAQNITLASAGSSAIYYTLDGTTPSGSSTLYTGTISISTAKTLKAIAYNVAGTPSASTMSEAYSFDVTAPTTSPSASSGLGAYTFGNFTNQNVLVTLSCTDNIGGVGCDTPTYPKYCVSTADTCTPTTSYTVPVVVSAEGTSYIRYFSQDTIPNTETVKSSIIKIDKSTPVISSISPVTGSSVNTGQAITFTTNKVASCRIAFSDTAKSYDQMSSDCSVTNGIQMSCVTPDLGAYGTKNAYLACLDSYGNKDTSGSATHISYTYLGASGGGGGGGGNTPTPVTPSQNTYTLSINGGAGSTDNRVVNLSFSSSAYPTAVTLATNPDFYNAITVPYSSVSPTVFNLCGSQTTCGDASYTVYAKFLDNQGGSSPVISSHITLNAVPLITEVTKNITNTVSDIINALKPASTEENISYPPINVSVPSVAQNSFQDKWKIVVPASMKDFVFSDLPKDFQSIVNKFPQVSQTLEKVGVNKMSDASSLVSAEISLPNLGETVSLPSVAVNTNPSSNGSNLPEVNVNTNLSSQSLAIQTVPVSQLSVAQSQKLPTDLVFVRTADEKIDLNVKLSIDNNGLALQTLNTIQGQNLKFVVKPEQSAKSVIGYLIFKSNTTAEGQSSHGGLSFGKALTADALYADELTGTVGPNTDLVLNKFFFKDTGNGVWTADVASPAATGKYELRTVVNYKDTGKTPKQISMMVVVDPEGYIFQKLNSGEFRITGADVSIFWLNPKTKAYELWPANDFRQTNPQTTDVTGRYAFLVPPGMYYLKVTAPSYSDYQNAPFKVEESKGVFMNIEMRQEWSFVNLFSVQNILLGIISVVLIYIAIIFTIRRRKKL